MGSVKVSFRSRAGLDCSQLAEGFGGGGHKAAAGAMVPGPLSAAEPRVLDAVHAQCDNSAVRPAFLPALCVTQPKINSSFARSTRLASSNVRASGRRMLLADPVAWKSAIA